MPDETISPLTPPGCDLREFPFMPLDVVRLRDSDIAAVSTGDEFRCAVILWCASWHQIPAASLPDDDVVLSQLAGFGRVVKEWKKVRSGALRGWVKCSDGRLYHPVVAEKANEAWSRKLERSWNTECGRIKKLNQRHDISLPFPTLEQFLSPDYVPPKAPPAPNVSPGTNAKCPEGHDNDVPNVSPGKSCRQGDGEDSGQGEGQGQGQGQLTKPKEEQAASTAQPLPRDESPPAAALDPITYRSIELVALLRRGASLQASNPIVREWAERGITDAQALTALEIAEQRRSDQANPQAINAGFLNAILGDVIAPKARASPPARNTREARISNYAAEAAQARGEHENEHGTGRTERDITGESVRIA